MSFSKTPFSLPLQKTLSCMINIGNTSVTFSSMLPPSVLVDSEDDGSEHRISVIINNTTIYSTTLNAVENKSVFYDLNSLVSDYMAAHGLPICTLTFEALFDYHQETASTTVVYASQPVDCNDIPDFLMNNYLTTRSSFVIPAGCSQKVHLFIPQGTAFVKGKMDVLFSFMGKNETITLDFTLPHGDIQIASININAKLFTGAIRSIHPQGDIRVLSARISHGQRQLDFYFTEEQPLCSFEFLNIFCLPEICHVFGTQKITTEFKQEEGSVSGITQFYNRSSKHAVQIETAPLQQQEALWLNQFLGSPKVSLLTPQGAARDVLISDITSEIFDDPNEQVTLKFTWSYNTKSNILSQSSSTAIFTDSFNNSFS